MMKQVVLHLLDSAQGHPLQTWTFERKGTITVGRSSENDVIVTDPYVSRSHAYICNELGDFKIISLSKNQLSYQGRIVPELALTEGMVFRLGANGCYLRFGQAEEPSTVRQTIMYDPMLMPVFQLNQEQLQTEVTQITDAPYFQQLRDAARQLRDRRQGDA